MINILKKTKILYKHQCIYILGGLFTMFFNMSDENKKIKNLKISEEIHDILKEYCEKRGIKIYRFLEKLILEKCKNTKDPYSDN